MLIIRYYHKYDDLRLFDPITQEISKPIEAMNERPKTYGFFGTIGGVQFVLYRDQRLMLSIDGVNYVFGDLNVSTNTISHTVTDGRIDLVRYINIYCNDEVIFESEYNECGPYFEFDFTMYDVEDFDFGLFLDMFSKSKEKCEQLFND